MNNNNFKKNSGKNSSNFDGLVEDKSQKKPLFTVIIILLIIICLVAAYFLYKKHVSSTQKSGSNQISSKMKQKRDLVTQIRGLETEVSNKQNEIFKLMGKYKEKTGKDLSLASTLNLTAEEKEILQKKIKEEKDVSMKTLLGDILDKSHKINDAQKKIQELEALLPKPYVVQKGDNHYKVAMDFLVNKKGLDKKEAMRLVERSALFEPMVPGFKIWNFYSNGEYGTFVTQGDAAVSPNTMRRKAKKELVDARDTAISERDKLADDIKQLEAKRDEIISQLDLLNKEKNTLMENNSKLQTSINSIYFILNSKKELKEKEIIKGGFLKSTKLNDLSPDKYTNTMDLRLSDVIDIRAEQLKFEKIKKILIFPKLYKKDVDYKISIAEDKKTATIKLLQVDKFRKSKIVIAVE